jgi:hypothetical protein
MMFPVVPVGRKPKSLPAFIVAGNGIFLRKESPLGITQTRVSNVAHLPHMTPTLEYKLPPIPKKLSAQIAGFLLKVDKLYHCEGALLLCLDKKNKWRIVVPRQDPTGMDVKYFVDEDTVPDGWTLAGTVHSHPFNTTSAPTASWTDESDERKIDGVHLVAGSLEHEPKYGAAVVVNGTRFKYLNWQDLITPAEADTDSVPDEWFDKIEKKKPGVVSKVVKKVTSYGSSYNYTPDYLPKEGETVEQAIARARKSSFEWINESANKLGYRLVWSLEEVPGGATEIAETSQANVQISDTVNVGAGGTQVAIMSPTPGDNVECACLVCDCGLGPSNDLQPVGDRLVCKLCRQGNHGSMKKKQNGALPTSVDTPSGPMTIKADPPAPLKDPYGRCPDCEHMWANHDAAGCKLVNLSCSCDTPKPEDDEKQQVLYDPEAFIEGPIWRNAQPIRCKEKHPTKDCPPKGCGCHCEPCRKKLVGAYNAADVEDLPINEEFSDEDDDIDRWHGMGRAPEEDECKCDECIGGCFAYLGIDYKEQERTLCNDCQRGAHYQEDGTVTRVGGTA